MSVSAFDLNRAIAAARQREAQGYFDRVRQGDQRAASYFARLVAYDLNPSGAESDFGWLTKTPGESQVEGYAEDAIVFGANPADLDNVIDMVNGAGAPGASIGGSVKPRRENNRWATPRPLTTEQMRYLNPAFEPGIPPPSNPPPQPPSNDLATIKAQLEALTNVVGSLTVAIANLHADDVSDLRNRINDIRNTLRNGLALDAQGRIPFAGNVTLKGSAKG